MVKQLQMVGLLSLVASQAYGDMCKISGASAAMYAYQKGYGFSFTESGDASCQLSTHRAGGSAVLSATGAGYCDFEFFADKQLSDNWTFQDVRYSGSNFTIVSAPSAGESNVHIVARLSPPASGVSTFLLSQIFLEGDSCEDWESAF